MAYSHFFFIEENHLPYILKLFSHKNNGEYVVLNESNGFSDIAQYSEKYENIRVITVPTNKLNVSDRLY